MSNHSAKGLSMAKILEIVRLSLNPSEDQQIIELVCAYLKRCKQDHTHFDAKRWIKSMSKNIEYKTQEKSTISLVKKFKIIRNVGLLSYLHRLGISPSLAKFFLKELKVYNSQTGKTDSVLGFRHEKDGFVVSSPNLEGWIENPSISFVKGQEQESTSDTIHIFHTFWDYLSLLTHLKNKDLQADTIILNSYDCIPQVKAYLHQYGYRKAYTWLSNDTVGKEATRKLSAFISEEDNFIHISMNTMYLPFTHLKDWYQQQVQFNQ